MLVIIGVLLLIVGCLFGSPIFWLRNTRPGLRAFCYSMMMIFTISAALVFEIDEVRRGHHSIIFAIITSICIIILFGRYLPLEIPRIWKRPWRKPIR